tara:strand:- start:3323 stop:3568 length:246 start_codon:yes stop_codon:yes gene_type:complete
MIIDPFLNNPNTLYYQKLMNNKIETKHWDLQSDLADCIQTDFGGNEEKLLDEILSEYLTLIDDKRKDELREIITENFLGGV